MRIIKIKERVKNYRDCLKSGDKYTQEAIINKSRKRGAKTVANRVSFEWYNQKFYYDPGLLSCQDSAIASSESLKAAKEHFVWIKSTKPLQCLVWKPYRVESGMIKNATEK